MDVNSSILKERKKGKKKHEKRKINMSFTTSIIWNMAELLLLFSKKRDIAICLYIYPIFFLLSLQSSYHLFKF